MKDTVLFISLILCSILVIAQEQQEVNLIQVDSTWGKEIIQIPFWFAPEIDYKGYEDIRFAKGWEKIDSDGFWTLVFAWDINLNSRPTPKFLEDNLALYFDGLMKVVNEDASLKIPETKAYFKEEKQIDGVTIFKGTLETYDGFITKKLIKLNVIIESVFREDTKTYIPLFKLSPRDFKHKSWDMLNQAKLNL